MAAHEMWCYSRQDDGSYEPRILIGFAGGRCDEHGDTNGTVWADPAMDSPGMSSTTVCSKCLSEAFGDATGYYTTTRHPDYPVIGLDEAAATQVLNDVITNWLVAALT